MAEDLEHQLGGTEPEPPTCLKAVVWEAIDLDFGFRMVQVL